MASTHKLPRRALLSALVVAASLSVAHRGTTGPTPEPPATDIEAAVRYVLGYKR